MIPLSIRGGEETSWFYEDGLTDYLREAVEEYTYEGTSGGSFVNAEAAEWAVTWLQKVESGYWYVNLIPTALAARTSMACDKVC